jgi:N-acetyltransferase 10
MNCFLSYRPGDAVESWLNKLLCLDVSNVTAVKSGCPPKEDCELYYINRDTLFCYHRNLFYKEYILVKNLLD